MTELDDLAADVQAGLADLAGPLVYRVTTNFTAKTTALVPVGATSVTLGTLPAGFDRILAGDTAVIGGAPRTFTADALAVAGTITASFTPALTAQVAASTSVSVVRVTDTACRGFMELLDTSTTLAPGVAVKDCRYSVLANTLPVTPKATSGIMVGPDGTPRTVKNAGLDPAGAVWEVLCS